MVAIKVDLNWKHNGHRSCVCVALSHEIRTPVNTLNYLSPKSRQQQIHRIISHYYTAALIHTPGPATSPPSSQTHTSSGETRRWHEKHRVEMQAAPRNLSMMNYHRHQSSLIWRFHCRLRDGPREFMFALIYGIMLRSDRHHQNGTKPQRLRESAREKSLQLPTVNFLRKIPEKLFYHLRWYQVDSHDSCCGMWQRCLHMIHRRDDPFTFFFFVPQNGFTIVLEKSRQGPHEATWFFCFSVL